MQNVELFLNHTNLFCPVTGQKIIDEDGNFTPSNTLVYCFIDEAGGFEYAKEGIESLFETCMKEKEEELEEAYALFIEKLEEKDETENWLCMTINSNIVGPMEQFGKFCFDMNYNEKI
ncbi:hypothetical protein [Namhaeicola litoreus]|uniref:Uncharacterized protein n=1 Tax=Namhaeicola litoreus TaxID=1052145 RepID=A0ABW3Y1E7_9FLAO